VIRAARRRVRLPEFDAAAVPRVALLGVALSGLAVIVAAAALAVVVIGLGHKADRADLRSVKAEHRASTSDAKASALQLSVCRLAYVQRPGAPGIAPPLTARASAVAPYWQDLFAHANCSGLPLADLARPPTQPAAPPTPTPTPGGHP
jgi:hypothetical protein